MDDQANFTKAGFVIASLFTLLIIYGWPSILLGIGGIFLIDHVKSSERIDPSKIAYVKGAVEIKSVQQRGDAMIAVIKNTYPYRVYNLRLTCWGGPSLRDTSGWLNPSEERTFDFAMTDTGPHTDCLVGFDIDDVNVGPGKGERHFEDFLTATVEPIFKGSRVAVGGSIINYSDQRVSGVRLTCYFTKGQVDAQDNADVAASASPQATGAVNGSFETSYAPPANGMFCKAVNTNFGDFFR